MMFNERFGRAVSSIILSIHLWYVPSVSLAVVVKP